MVMKMDLRAVNGSSRKLLMVAVSALLIISCLGLIGSSPIGKADAASLSFSVAAEDVNVTVVRDGSVDIDYHFLFTGVSGLDGVDIGMPNSFYNLSTATSRIVVHGTTYAPALVHVSPNIDQGVAVEFSSALQATIQNAGTFDLYFHINNPHMVYLNTLVNNTVGVSFTPTWFDSSYQQGNTGVLVERLIFPVGFDNESQAYWLQDHPWDSLTFDNTTHRLVATSDHPGGQHWRHQRWQL